jgi:hypothetical protein
MTQIRSLGRVRFHGLRGGKNASAVAAWNDTLFVVSDEPTERGNVVQMFEPDGDDYRAVSGGVIVLDAAGTNAAEMDLEGLAVGGDALFVLGSHSARRRKVDPDKRYEDNRTALMSGPELQPARDVLLQVSTQTRAVVGRTSLRSFIETTEPFKSFRSIASKENGIDAEGLAMWNGSLYVGFRGPVLRGNFTPIVRCRFDVPVAEGEVLFVDVGGRGIRDLAAAEQKLLILAGPVGDGPGSYQVYAWDGRDGVPGKGAPAPGGRASLTLLGDLPDPGVESGEHPAAKAEGLTVLGETKQHCDLLVVYDGLKNGHGVRFRVPTPP